jgi:hypothetical protein
MNYDTVILSRFDVSMAWKKVVPLPSGLLYIKADAYSRLVTVTSLFLCLLAIFVFSYWYEMKWPRKTGHGPKL